MFKNSNGWFFEKIPDVSKNRKKHFQYFQKLGNSDLCIEQKIPKLSKDTETDIDLSENKKGKAYAQRLEGV